MTITPGLKNRRLGLALEPHARYPVGISAAVAYILNVRVPIPDI